MNDGEIKLDLDRAQRIGLAEAVLSASKNAGQLAQILNDAAQRRMSLLLTRLSPAQFDALPRQHCPLLDYDPVSQTAFFGEVKHPLRGTTEIAVVTAGTSDVPVALEAIRTLRFYGHDALAINDVGVAGIWRLFERLASLKEMSVIIVAAGMDGALPSVIAGLVSGCVIAVPTSVGYGVADGGKTALNAALASCAPGLVVVNIDNGYGAACAALRIVGRKKPGPRLQESDTRFYAPNGVTPADAGASNSQKGGRSPTPPSDSPEIVEVLHHDPLSDLP
jgi:pyridinium-3,5-biscarboxylic acid mononucleotide synthase